MTRFWCWLLGCAPHQVTASPDAFRCVMCERLCNRYGKVLEVDE